MTSTRARKLTFAALSTAILMAVVATLLFAMPNGAFAAEPDRPTALTATAVDHDTVSLTWSHPDPDTVDHYQVLSRTVGASTGLLQVGTSSSTSFEHDGLEPESTYIYRVKPVNAAGEEGRRSARAEATTPADDTPAPAPEPDPTPAPPQRSDDKGQDNIARSSHNVLVSNTGQTSEDNLTTQDRAQTFTTGTNSAGYVLSSIVIGYNDTAGDAFTASVWTTNSSGLPNTLKHLLTAPGTFSQADLTFTAPANATLDASTTYTVKMERTSGSLTFKRTSTINPDEDSGAAAGWSIGDTYHYDAGATYFPSSSNKPMLIAIHGTLSTSTTSTDATLSDLELEDDSGTAITLSPSFVSGTTTYTAQVINSVDEITITPSVNDSNATYEVQNNSGTALTDSDTNTTGFQVELSEGANTIKVEVTAQDASTETYTVTVTRTPADCETDDIWCATLTVGTHTTGGITFYGYNFAIGGNVTGSVSPNTFIYRTATVGIVDLQYDNETPSSLRFDIGRASGVTPSDGILGDDDFTFHVGTQTFAIDAPGVIKSFTFPDHGVSWTVGDTVTVRLVKNRSNDATLSALTVNDGTNDLTLTPTFAPGTTTYTAPVVNSVDEITITPTVNDTTTPATYEIQNSAGTALTDADTNTTGFQVALSVGANIIKVEVTAEDASTETYTVTVTRAAAATPTVSISADKTTAVYREDTITYTLTRIGSTAAALPVSVTFTQTKDFLATTELTKTVTIPAGQTTKTFNVAGSSFQLFAAGTAVEGGTLTATVQDGTDYDLGTSSSVAVDIVIGATVRFDMASYSVAEANGTLTVKQIARTGAGAPQPSSTTSSLFFDSIDGTARNAVDFGFSSVATSFTSSAFTSNGGVWQAEESFNISITPDDIDEADETFTLEFYYQLGHQNTPLVDASGNSCGTKCTVTVTIVDDDTAGVTVSKSAVTVTEEDTTGDTYTVVLDSQPTATVTITIGGQGAADITATPTPLTFTTTNWATAQTVTVTAGNDTDTVTDTHSLTHSAASSDAKYSGIPIANVGVTVNDNDSTIPALSFDNINISVAEDDSQATLSVELSQTSTDTVTVDYATSDITAEAGDDYTETSGTLTFAPGETVKAIIVPILDDAIYETLERFNVTLSNPAGATLPAFPGAQINIALDESPPTASIPNVTVDEGAGTMTLTLNLSHESSRSTSYRTQTSYIGGTATQGTDYENFLSGGQARITVPAGDTQATLDITITDDTAAESSETITIRWDNDPTGISNGDATPDTINFTGTITDNDSADDSATGKPGITGAAQAGMTLTAGTTNIMDTDGLNSPGYTYQWLRAGSNISGATSNTYTLTSSDYGETIKVKVNFTDDANNPESLTSDETLPVAPVAATCPTDTDTVWCATLTVGHSLDSDGDPSGSGFESRSGRTAFGSLSGATFTHLGVNYTVKTVWGGGRNDLVFSTTPNLPLDGAGLTLHVQVYDGELDAPLADASFNSSDHWFFGTALYVDSAGQLSNVPLIRGQYSSGARVQAPPDVGTKVMVRLSVNNTAPSAPRNLNATAVGDNRINLTWDAPSSNGGSAITGYKIEVSNNGRTNWTTRVANTGSSNRTHSHTGLSAGDIRHYRVSAINASGTGPHSNVDSATTGLPTVSIANATTTEGGDIVFVITISPTIDGFLSVSYGTGTDSLPAGSMGARKDDDYVPHHPAGANVQIGYGQSSVELTFTTVDDDLVEGTEIFGIGLYPSAYEGRDFSYAKRTAIATIRDDENGGQAYQDSVPGDTSTNRPISAGGSVTNRIETVDDADWYRATLTKDHCYQIKVEGSTADETLTLQYPAVRGVYRSDGTHILNTYENAGGRGTTAISNVKLDTTGTYYIAAGLYRFENGGTFRMSLTDLGTTDTSCGAAKPGGPMQISVADTSVRESSDRRKYMSFIVTLDRRADAAVTVDYTTVNGTATAGQDYEATSGTLVFDQGDVQKTIDVPIEYDSHDEDDETLTLVLSNPTVAQIERGVATGTIVDYE